MARGTAVVGGVLGLLVLVGWRLNSSILQTVWPGRPAMTPVVAVMFVFLGVALWLAVGSESGSNWGFSYWILKGMALLVVWFGLGTLAYYLVGWPTRIHFDYFPFPSAGGEQAVQGRSAFTTGICALGLGLGVLLIDVQIRGVWLAQVCGVITIHVALLALIGHVFGVAELYGSLDFGRESGMAFHSGIGFLLLSVGLLCARPDHGLMSVLRSGTAGGTLARRWMFMPALVLLAMGVVYLTLNRGFGVRQSTASWALFMTSLTFLSVSIWVTAEALNAAGLERESAQRHLEQRVRERTAELNQANEALNAAKEELARANHDLEDMVQERTTHLRETIRSLETVCYNIAHDLRAPNRAIAGFAQVLLSEHRKDLDTTAVDCLQRIAKAAQRSDALTLDLLAYGRLGHADLPCSRQHLKGQLDHVLEQLASEIAHSGANIKVVEPLPDLWANPTALEQVLLNLLSNALKFVDVGVRPEVIIRVQDAGENWRVLVQDNGIGVPLEHQQKIFGVFQRLHAPEKYSGSGIGLAIVQKGIERMGGRVGMLDSVESGSCFWFELRKV